MGNFKTIGVHLEMLKVKSIRYGGNNVDLNKPLDRQYLEVVDSAQLYGIEPMLTVPYLTTFDTTRAKQIVTYINVTKGRNVKYWIIGNEPNLAYPDGSGHGFSASNYSYIKHYAAAMKRVDSTIKIIAPEISQFQYDLMNDLLNHTTYKISGQVPGHTYYYVDYMSFHYYGFGNSTQTNYYQVFNKLYEPWNRTNPSLWKYWKDLHHCIDTLNDFLATANSSRINSKIKIAITEMNLNGGGQPNNNFNGLFASGFVAGQVWAEAMSIAMKDSVEIFQPWSTIEGNNDSYDIGFLFGNNSAKKSTYYHVQQLAENFSGNYCQGSTNQTYLKAFAAKSGDKVAVMIMNQDSTTTFNNYTVYLDWNATTSGTYVKLDAGLTGKTYTDSIEYLSTTVLIFNKCGDIVSKKRYRVSQNNSPAGFQTAWASNSPKTVYTALSAGASQTICCPGCSGTFTATSTPTASSGSYSWKRNTTSVGTGNPRSIIGPSANTTYTIEVSLDGCYTGTSSLIVGNGPNCSIVGIEDVNKSFKGIKSIVPNPTSGSVKISIEVPNESRGSTLVLTDLSGRIILQKEFSPHDADQEIDLSKLSNGIYMVTLSVEGEKIDSKRIILNR